MQKNGLHLKAQFAPACTSKHSLKVDQHVSGSGVESLKAPRGRGQTQSGGPQSKDGEAAAATHLVEGAEGTGLGGGAQLAVESKV